MNRNQATLRPLKTTPRRQYNWLVGFLVLTATLLLIHGFYTKKPISRKQDHPPPLLTQSPMQFDFYTVLPKMLVTTPTASTMSTAFLGQYTLQVAAFRQNDEAQRVRDQIQNLGFHAIIQEYQTGQGMWYRVILGPYGSSAQAERDQQQLKRHHIGSILLKPQER